MSVGFSSLFGGDDSEAQQYLQQALSNYQNVSAPSVAEQTVSDLPQESVQGEITPEQDTASTIDTNADQGIAIDPSSRAAQEQALGSYTGIADAGGLDANAELGIQQAVNAANEQSQGAQGAIEQSAQAEGQGGGLNALALRSIAAQGASNTAATTGQQEAAEAETNRENALSQMSSIGSNIENTDYSQAANTAAAQNTINATNAAAKNTATQTNVANNFNAQANNINNAQGVNAANTAANQNQVYYNAQLPQQQFNDELAKANGESGVSSNQAASANAANANSAAATGQLVKGGATLGAAALAAAHGGAVTKAGMVNGMQCYAQGGEVHNHFLCMLGGGPVPGEANVPGDSAQNDTVPAKLSPGEIVVPRSKAADPEQAGKFAKKVALDSFVKGYKKPKGK